MTLRGYGVCVSISTFIAWPPRIRSTPVASVLSGRLCVINSLSLTGFEH